MINVYELGRSPTRSDNVCFAYNEQASHEPFAAAFCFARSEHNFIPDFGVRKPIMLSRRYLP